MHRTNRLWLIHLCRMAWTNVRNPWCGLRSVPSELEYVHAKWCASCVRCIGQYGIKFTSQLGNYVFSGLSYTYKSGTWITNIFFLFRIQRCIIKKFWSLCWKHVTTSYDIAHVMKVSLLHMFPCTYRMTTSPGATIVPFSREL